MTNNDVLRRVRYTFDLEDADMITVFDLGAMPVTRAQVSDWLKRDDDPSFQPLGDHDLASFLNGFIVHRRGPRADGKRAVAETELTNNGIMVKLKIALSLQADDVLAMISSGDLKLSKHELSAFFRRPGHKHYRLAMNQVLRNFLHGMQERFRPSQPTKPAETAPGPSAPMPPDAKASSPES